MPRREASGPLVTGRPNAAFANAGVCLVLLTVGAGAPAALLSAAGTSDAALTGSFAMYMLGTVLALLFLSRVSDVVGRNTGAATAVCIAISGNSMVAAATGHTELLMLGRLAQGTATGMGIAVLSLYLIELRRPQLDAWPAVISSIGAPVGIAAGALTGGVISDVLGFSGQWIYVVVNVLLAGCLVGLLRSPKTTPRQRGLLASLRPVLAAPTSMGWLCAALSTAMVAAWSVGSLYQSLGSAMVATYLDHNGSLFAGVVVGMVIGLTTVGGPSFARVSPTTATFCSLLTITVGMIGMVLGLHLHDEPVFLVFSAVSGVGFGGATTGILRTVMAEVPSDEIGRFLTIVYLAGFVGSAFPAAIAAILDSHVGIRVALVGHASFVVAFAIVSSALLARVQMESSTTARG